MKTAVITLAHGRHAHLQAQRAGLDRQTTRADLTVVVAMDDAEVGAIVARDPLPTALTHLPLAPLGLPLAAARNAGARLALGEGAQLLVFLDVDCIPGPTLVAGYAAAAGEPRWAASLLGGPVTYLEPPGPHGYDVPSIERLDAPHPARPAPRPGTIERGADRMLFWSLSFATTAETWRRIGGFHEGYAGYGAEDTDFACIAEHAGAQLAWVGDARAYHQWHPTSTPPVQHVRDIARNANLFHARWGEWPMLGWLREFRERGLVSGGFGDELCVVAPGFGAPHLQRRPGDAA